MSDHKLVWSNRLSTRQMRFAWWASLERLGLFADVRASDAQGRTDETATHYLIGRRTVAIEEFHEAKQYAPALVAEGFAEYFAPAKAQQDKENENG